MHCKLDAVITVDWNLVSVTNENKFLTLLSQILMYYELKIELILDQEWVKRDS
jgi:hypothetical protein